jgi:hypothetical protein
MYDECVCSGSNSHLQILRGCTRRILALQVFVVVVVLVVGKRGFLTGVVAVVVVKLKVGR